MHAFEMTVTTINMLIHSQIQEEYKAISTVRIGDTKASLSRPAVASEEVDKLFNMAIT